MLYDSHRIQPEGWAVEIDSQTEVLTREHREGKAGKAGKNRSWKHRSTCQNCGAEFAGRKDGANRFCKNDCQHEFALSRWFSCSCCLAKIGVGGQTASKILGIVTAHSINRQWNAKGIVCQKPTHAGWFMAAKKIIAESSAWVGSWESAWMEEVKPPRFPDWSSLWGKEKARLRANQEYMQLSIEEKAKRNKRNQECRARRFEKRPDAKKAWEATRDKWKAANKPKLREYIKRSNKARKQRDPGFKIQCNLRHRFKEIIGKAKKGGTHHFTGLIGCSTEQLAKHLESSFTKRMTWENYGTYWHVDHVIPCAAFDHTDSKQRAACWHWTNLQPMEAKANMKKSNKIENAQMSLRLCASH